MSQPVAGTINLASSEPMLLHNISPVRLVAWPQVGDVSWSGVEAAHAPMPTTVAKAADVAIVHASRAHHASATAPQPASTVTAPHCAPAATAARAAGVTAMPSAPVASIAPRRSVKREADSEHGDRDGGERHSSDDARAVVDQRRQRAGEHHHDGGDRPGETVAQRRRDVRRRRRRSIGARVHAEVLARGLRDGGSSRKSCRRGTRLGL